MFDLEFYDCSSKNTDNDRVFQGEKLLGSLGGIFSKTWKPKKTRQITGPVIVAG